MREPTLLFGTLRPDSTGAVSPLWKGLEPPGAGPDRPSSPAAREQCSWFLHLRVGRLFQLQKSLLRWQAWVEGRNREELAPENNILSSLCQGGGSKGTGSYAVQYQRARKARSCYSSPLTSQGLVQGPGHQSPFPTS